MKKNSRNSLENEALLKMGAEEKVAKHWENRLLVFSSWRGK
jgi:hypothetical protein